MNLRKWMPRVAAVLVALVVLAQFVPVARTNPPVTGEVEAPDEVRAVLEQSCYDCHSNETRWPWYSRVAPVSWLVSRDVQEAREHLNFSEWDSMSAGDCLHAREEVWEEVEDGEMPLWFYVPLHPEAKLDEADHAALRDWAEAAEREAEQAGIETEGHAHDHEGHDHD